MKFECRSTRRTRARAASARTRPHLSRRRRRSRPRRYSPSGRDTGTLSTPCSRPCRPARPAPSTTTGTFTWCVRRRFARHSENKPTNRTVWSGQASTRMEERLDDAINVLRNHAESLVAQQQQQQQPMIPGQGAPISHSNGLMASGYPPVLEPLMVRAQTHNVVRVVDPSVDLAKQQGGPANPMGHASSSYNPAGPMQMPLHEAVEAARALVEAPEKPSTISSECAVSRFERPSLMPWVFGAEKRKEAPDSSEASKLGADGRGSSLSASTTTPTSSSHGGGGKSKRSRR